MTARTLIQRLERALLTLYDPREAHQIALLVAAHQLGAGTHTATLLADPEREIPLSEAQVEVLTQRLSSGEPMQYVLGETDFFGRLFKVDARVLIPRPETEELIDLIRRNEPHARQLLDIGTGSGCIAISLALELPEAEVTAIDLSPEALEVARENATALGAHVTFIEADALHGLEERFAPATFDVLVSNPPYIPDADRQAMHCNVVEHEPHLALFVPDDDPLRFYRAIARAGQHLLTEGGALYFEIYHLAADALCQLMEELGYTAITIHRDLCDKPRMLCCRKSR